MSRTGKEAHTDEMALVCGGCGGMEWAGWREEFEVVDWRSGHGLLGWKTRRRKEVRSKQCGRRREDGFT